MLLSPRFIDFTWQSNAFVLAISRKHIAHISYTCLWMNRAFSIRGMYVSFSTLRLAQFRVFFFFYFAFTIVVHEIRSPIRPPYHVASLDMCGPVAFYLFSRFFHNFFVAVSSQCSSLIAASASALSLSLSASVWVWVHFGVLSILLLLLVCIEGVDDNSNGRNVIFNDNYSR